MLFKSEVKCFYWRRKKKHCQDRHFGVYRKCRLLSQVGYWERENLVLGGGGGGGRRARKGDGERKKGGRRREDREREREGTSSRERLLLTSTEDINWRAITSQAWPPLELPSRACHEHCHHLLPVGGRWRGKGMGREGVGSAYHSC